MATKHQVLEDQNSCFHKASLEEPIFVLRGKDPLAAQTVRNWAEDAGEAGGQEKEKIDEAFKVADEMDYYRHKLANPKK